MIDLARIVQKLHARPLSRLQPILILKGSAGHFCAGADIRQTVFSLAACTSIESPRMYRAALGRMPRLTLRRAATAILMTSLSPAAPLSQTASLVSLVAAA